MNEATAPVVEVFSSFQGEGLLVGVRQVFVRLAGCPLGCRYCDTAAARQATPVCRVWHDPVGEAGEDLPNPITASRLTAIVSGLAAATPPHSVSFTGGEPLLHPDFLAAVAQRLIAGGLLTYLDTACCLPEAMAKVAPLMAWVAADYKLPSTMAEPVPFEDFAACWSQISGRRFVKLVVTSEVSPAEMADFCHQMQSLDPAAQLVLQPVTPVVPGVEPPGPQLLSALAATCAECFAEVRVIPQCHRVLGVR